MSNKEAFKFTYDSEAETVGLKKTGNDDEIPPLTEEQTVIITRLFSQVLDDLASQVGKEDTNVSFFQALNNVKIDPEDPMATIWVQLTSHIRANPFDPFISKEELNRIITKAQLTYSAQKRRRNTGNLGSPKKSPRQLIPPSSSSSQRRTRDNINDINWDRILARNYKFDAPTAIGKCDTWYNELQKEFNLKGISHFGDDAMAQRRLEVLQDKLKYWIQGPRTLDHRKYWFIVEVLRKCHIDFHISDADFEALNKSIIRYGQANMTIRKAIHMIRKTVGARRDPKLDITSNDEEWEKNKSGNYLGDLPLHQNQLE